MSEFEIRFLGTKSTINTNESIDEIKKKLAGEHIEPVFNGVDANGNEKIDDGAELDTFKRNLKAQGYEIAGEEGTQKPKAPRQSRSYNQAIQNMTLRYGDVDALKNNFEQGDDKLHKLKSGDTLWGIAKQALKDEGLEATNKAINDRISQIAVINGIKDVNNVNIKKHPTLIVHLTSSGVEKVKASEGQNSVAALGGTAQGGKVQGKVQGKEPDKVQGKEPDKVQGKEPDKVQGKEPDKADETGDKSNGAETQTKVQTQVEPSSITLSKNVNLADGGWTVAEDQSDVKTDGFTGFNKDTDSVKKYVKTEGEETKVMYQFESKDGNLYVTAGTLEELQTKVNTSNKKYSEIKAAPENEKPEDAKQRKADNLVALKESIASVDYNIEYVKNAIACLCDDTKFDRTSPEFKAFVDDLIRTRDTEVLTYILTDFEKNDNALLVNDEQSSKDVAGLYKEIRDKEKAGERLTDEEIALKSLLKGFDLPMYTVQADTEKGVHAKSMTYNDNMTFYRGSAGGIGIMAETEEMFEEFAGKLDEISKESDNGKKQEALKALFKEYSTTTDKALAHALVKNAKTFNAAQEDLFALIDNNDLSVLSDIDMPKEYKSEADKVLVDKVIAKFEETFKNGDIDNANYLKCAFDWLEKRGDVTTGEGEKAQKTTVADFKQQILESFFTKTVTTEKDENDKDKEVTTYTFNPDRKPTPEEMEGLANAINSFYGSTPNESTQAAISEEMAESVVSLLTIEDMGKGRLSEILENKCSDECVFGGYAFNLVSKYAGFAETLETEEDALKFIENIQNKQKFIPYDKIMEKFPESEEIQLKLLKEVHCNSSSISKENLVKLLSKCMQIDGDKVTFDKTKLPEGIKLNDIVKAFRTYNTNREDIKPEEKATEETLNKYTYALLKTLGKADYAFIQQLYEQGTWDVKIKEKLGELVEAEFKASEPDREFLNKVLGGNANIIPWDKFAGHEVILADFYCNPPEGVDNRDFKAILLNGVYDTPDKKAVLVEKYPNKNSQIVKDIINTTVYNKNSDNKNVGEISNLLYDVLRHIGAIREMGDGTIKISNRDNLYYRIENRDFNDKKYLEIISNTLAASALYDNIHNNNNEENKDVQINYTQAFGEMSPTAVVELFKGYKGIKGNKEGLLTALDFEANGASLADMMTLVQKVVAYAVEKGKGNAPEMKALLDKLQDYQEFMTDSKGNLPKEGSQWLIVDDPEQFLNKKFTDRAKERDFSGHYGIDTVAHGIASLWGGSPAEKFDELVEALINVCG